MEKELVELFEVARKAADKVNREGVSASRHEISVCVEALKQMRNLAVTEEVLASTQIARRLRLLTNHCSSKTRHMAFSLLEFWKLRQAQKTSPGTKSKKPSRAAVNIVKKDNTSSFKCGDDSRDKIREILAEALSKVVSEVRSQEMRVKVMACDPYKVAVSIESAMYKKLGPFTAAPPRKLKDIPFRMKYRATLYKITCSTNHDLRMKLILGQISPNEVVY